MEIDMNWYRILSLRHVFRIHCAKNENKTTVRRNNVLALIDDDDDDDHDDHDDDDQNIDIREFIFFLNPDQKLCFKTRSSISLFLLS